MKDSQPQVSCANVNAFMNVYYVLEGTELLSSFPCESFPQETMHWHLSKKEGEKGKNARKVVLIFGFS